MWDKNADMNHRLKASGYIAKNNSAIVEKKELQSALNNKIEI
jgi:hypothetical protein